MATVFNDANEKIGQRFKYNNKYCYIYDIEIEPGTETDAPEGSFASSKAGVSNTQILVCIEGAWAEYSGNADGGSGQISEDDFTNLIASLDEAVAVSPDDEISINQNNILVSGAGTVGANGIYTYRGVSDGKPFYNKVGELTNVEARSIFWLGGAWFIKIDVPDEGQLAVYGSSEGVATPDLVSVWTTEEGILPVPIVIAVPISRKIIIEDIFKADFSTGTLEPSAQFFALQNDIVVEGAGTAAANETYSYRGLTDEWGSGFFPYWNIEGQPNETTHSVLVQTNVNNFALIDEFGSGLYVKTGASPFTDSGIWEVNDGDPPVPTVTAVPSLKKVFPWQIANRGSVPHIESGDVLGNESCGQIHTNFGASGAIIIILDDNTFDEGWFATFKNITGEDFFINRSGDANFSGRFLVWNDNENVAELRDLFTCCIEGRSGASITIQKAGGRLNIIGVTGNWFDND